MGVLFDKLTSKLFKEQSGLEKVVIYPGRFQPMLPHHAQVYNALKQQHNNVYIATSDKVEPGRSPFTFDEKKNIMTTVYGIPEDRIITVRRPYNGDEYLEYFDGDNTLMMFAVGEKDMEADARFIFNVDPQTGYNMKKRVAEPTFIQPESALKQGPRSLTQMAYVITAPTVMAGKDVASASAFREMVRASDTPEQAVVDFLGDRAAPVAQLIASKLA